MTGAVSVSIGIYGCIRDIFESRYLCIVEDDIDDGGAAKASVNIKHTEL